MEREVGAPAALRLVAFGGGTGLPVLLAGLRERSRAIVTAVVTVADDGGSSGRLRRELGVAPPGDLRGCLASLAGDRALAEQFGYRFRGQGELGGHALGNVVIAGLAAASGDLCAGVERAARLLQTRGTVLPAACEPLTLALHAAGGATVIGESSAASLDGALAGVEVSGPGSAAPPAVIAAIEQADMVLLGPGSLFTSTIAALLGTGTRETLGRFRGPVLYIANLTTQPGETAGFSVADHVRAIARHGGPPVTDVLVPADRAPEEAIQRHRAAGAAPVRIDDRALHRLGVAVRRAPLLAANAAGLRHDPDRLAAAVLGVGAERVRATRRARADVVSSRAR